MQEGILLFQKGHCTHKARTVELCRDRSVQRYWLSIVYFGVERGGATTAYSHAQLMAALVLAASS
jgi:hypothetical protein